MTFGDVLRRKLQELDLTAAEVARRSGVTKQNLGRILNNTPHNQSGAIPNPSVETVDRIAKAIKWNINEARLAAGYAPTEPQTRIQKLIAALEAQGIDGLSMFGGFTQLQYMTDEQYDEVLRSIALVIDMSVQRSQQKDV